MRFIKQNNCYLDSKTNIEWYLVDAPTKLTWYHAVAWCRSIEGDWELPDRTELFYIVQNSSKLCTDLPDIKNGTYWSNSILHRPAAGAYCVNFKYGTVQLNAPHEKFYVRAIRYKSTLVACNCVDSIGYNYCGNCGGKI